MLFRRTERKKHSVCAILTVGALATIGAVAVTQYARQMLDGAVSKVKGFFSKEKCGCQSEDEC